MGAGVRVGVFGGTFDPPHLGHLIVAQEVAEEARLDRVVWIPAFRSPHKTSGPLTPARVRAEMVEAAIRGHPRFEVSDIELRRKGLSFTVDTLKMLKEQNPDWELALIIGSDQVLGLRNWRDPHELAELAQIIAMSREGVTLGAAPGLPEVDVLPVEVTSIGISSSLIRHRIARGRSIRYMVPDAVYSIIEREKLYRT